MQQLRREAASAFKLQGLERGPLHGSSPGHQVSGAAAWPATRFMPRGLSNSKPASQAPFPTGRPPVAAPPRASTGQQFVSLSRSTAAYDAGAGEVSILRQDNLLGSSCRAVIRWRAPPKVTQPADRASFVPVAGGSVGSPSAALDARLPVEMVVIQLRESRKNSGEHSRREDRQGAAALPNRALTA